MYVVGTQKNRLKETVLLSIQNIYNVLKVMGKKIFTILCWIFFLSKPMYNHLKLSENNPLISFVIAWSAYSG